MTKWGWPPIVSSNFSKKETSQVSPGLRHSSSCNKQWHYLTLPTVTDKTAPSTNMKTCLAHQNGDDAFVLLLYQVTNDFVVKVLHRLPLKLEGNIWGRKMLCWQGNININKYNLFVSGHTTNKGLTATPSVSYSSCSDLRVSSINSCWSFSLQ